ncbi:uncharacterized protein LOC124819131 [Hydra vulgaris]|uniref:uncharacterized protein LOC124819131 n=1 Tax=Hydra vulgaris TaxID=6087 RepID=UPI001F5F7706|nr:uncharacterized protein LOC124819131 [Hydra vulgaris]
MLLHRLTVSVGAEYLIFHQIVKFVFGLYSEGLFLKRIFSQLNFRCIYISSEVSPAGRRKFNSCNSLIHHEFIAHKEIHIKIGGDYGGGSLKMSYHILNTHNPNNKDNTIVSNIFEAKDYRINIKVAMARFQKQIDDLQKMKYKDYSIKVFVFGDYQFLCALYGISEASGRHSCLFCHATSSEMKDIDCQRTEIKVHTLEDLYIDYKRFMEKGGVKEDAKYFNNALTEPMLKIPLDQV